MIDWESVKREYEAGATLLDLYKKYGLTPPTIAKYLKEVGTQMHGKGGKANIPLDAVVEYLTTHVRLEDIAKKYNTTSVTFRRYVRLYLKEAKKIIKEKGLKMTKKITYDHRGFLWLTPKQKKLIVRY